MIFSGASAVAVITVGFMLERLFLMAWPWWAWGIIALLAIGVAIFANRMQAKQLAKMWHGNYLTPPKLPPKNKIQNWIRFVETYNLDWKSNRLNIIYEPIWFDMRPYLFEDTIAASEQRWDYMKGLFSALFLQKKPHDLIHVDHLKSLIKRDLAASLHKAALGNAQS